ncbi:hypothetical protein MTO96_005580 [Rhipicephalus appendiculatus]
MQEEETGREELRRKGGTVSIGKKQGAGTAHTARHSIGEGLIKRHRRAVLSTPKMVMQLRASEPPQLGSNETTRSRWRHSHFQGTLVFASEGRQQARRMAGPCGERKQRQ